MKGHITIRDIVTSKCFKADRVKIREKIQVYDIAPAPTYLKLWAYPGKMKILLPTSVFLRDEYELDILSAVLTKGDTSASDQGR